MIAADSKLHIRDPLSDAQTMIVQDFYSDCRAMLLVLEVIGGKVHGDRIEIQPYVHHDPQVRERIEQVRELLKQLSIACDFRGGGETTTAMGVQYENRMFTYWISSNQLLDKTSDFLEKLFATIRQEVVTLSTGKVNPEQIERALRNCLFKMITDHTKVHLQSNLGSLRDAIKKERKTPPPAATVPEDEFRGMYDRSLRSCIALLIHGVKIITLTLIIS